jgi:hypothetical protein
MATPSCELGFYFLRESVKEGIEQSFQIPGTLSDQCATIYHVVCHTTGVLMYLQ